MRLAYSPEAVADLARLRQFIADNNPAAATRIAVDLIARITYLAEFPEIGRRVEQAPDPHTIRDFFFGKYVVRYTIHERTVIVLRVWHHLESRKGR